MSQTVLSPTIALDPGTSWTVESLALTQDGNGTICSGAGKLVLKTFDNRLLIPTSNDIVGIEVELWGSCENALQNDTITDADGTLLKVHNGELNCDWQKPFTGANPCYQKINASDRTYYAFENEDGPTANGAEHFTTNYTVPTADYAVQAVIYRASDGGNGERAEIYARAALPYDFYFLAYVEDTDSWEMGYYEGARVKTVLGTYSGDAISLGGSRTARLEVNGTSIKAYIDGVQRIAATDSTYTGAGFVGLRLDAGASRIQDTIITTAAYDLGTPTTVTRMRRRYGTCWGNSYSLLLEASNDGTTWVDAFTGMPPADVPGSGTFAWGAEFDSSSITATSYRYWRTCVKDNGVNPDCRIGDFRLYTSGGIVTPGSGILVGEAHTPGTQPADWADVTTTTLFTDGSPGDNSTWVGGAISFDIANEGLQYESFRVEQLLLDSIQVGLSKDGTTFVGTPKTLLLSPTNTYTLMGTPSDLWGTTWAPLDIQSVNFALLIERTSANSAPIIDHARTIIYHTGSGGTFTMGNRETVRQRIQYGWESTFGTAATVNKRLRSIQVAPQANPEFKTFRPAGEKLESEHILTKEWSTASIAGTPCYNELGVLFSLMNGLPVSNGTANLRQEHFWRFDNRGEQKGRSISLEYGEEPSTIDVFGTPVTFNRGERMKAFTLAEMGVELSRSEPALSGNAFGYRKELDHVMSAGVNDQQTLTVSATGGSFKARFNGSAWATINVPLANAAAVDTAFEALATIGVAGLTVTGASSPFVIEFSGTSFAGRAVPLIEIDATLATGGTVTVTHTRPGGVTEFPIVAVTPEHINIYLADTYATLSSNRMQRCSVANFAMSDRFSPFWAFNRENGGNMVDKTEGTGIAARFGVKAHADSEATSLLGTARSNVRKFMRIEAIGPIAEGANTYEFVLDAAVKVAAVGTMEDEDGMYMANYELALAEDRTWGNSLIVWLRNMMANADYQ